jgi:uncharacterized surface protein with fasciclin (FAS1) repeats
MKYYLLYALGALLLITGCAKNEFVPPAEGEKVPYNGPTYTTLEENLKKSACQLFLKAYLRSNMDSVIKGESLHTLLAPTDAVLQNAGYTEASIAAMSREEADLLVGYYTVRGSYSKEQLQNAPASRVAYTYVTTTDKNWRIFPFYYLDGKNISVFFLRHQIAVSGENLLVDGVASGLLKDAQPATNGNMYVINRLLPKPVEKTFIEVLREDPRFATFMAVQGKTDSVYDRRYRDKMIEEAGFDPGGYGNWVDSRRMNYKDRFNPEPISGDERSVRPTMMFAPVNEAFQKAGFQSLSDIMDWNEKYKSPVILDWDLGDILPFGFPSDTVLAYHWDFGRDNYPYSPIYGKNPNPLPTVFFVNDLRDELLYDYPINTYSSSVNRLMPFTFGKTADGKVTVKIKGSSAAPAVIIETISTVMGPIHVVDRLLIPNNFKMQ